MGVRTHVKCKGKIPSTGGLEEGRTCDAASRRTASPAHYCLSYFSDLIMIIIIAFKGAIQDFCIISSLRRERSPTGTLKWSRHNGVQITCNTLSVHHVQHVVLRAMPYEGTAQLLSLTELKSHLFELYFIG